jgi:hypothetical protein
MPRRTIPHVLAWLVEQQILSEASLAPVLARVPLARYTTRMLGSEEGLDSEWWSVERDARLAELAVSRLPAKILADDKGLAFALNAARRTAAEGLFAYHVHRELRPAAEGVGMLIAAAHRLGVLSSEEIVAEAMALTAFMPSGLPPNVTHTETRGGAADHAGETSRVWPDVALLVTGVSDPACRVAILDTVESTIACERNTQEKVLEEAYRRCQSLLPPEGEIALLWLALEQSRWMTTGPRAQLLRARRGELERLHPSRQKASGLEINDVAAREGDTFVMLDDEAWASCVKRAFARPPEPRPVAATLREEMLRSFLERFQPKAAVRVDISAESLATAQLADLADALFAELGEPRQATLAIARVPPWVAPADLSERIARELRAFGATKKVPIELRSATIHFRGDGHLPPGRVRHLSIVLAVDATQGRTGAEEIAESFVAEVCRRHPYLCKTRDVSVEPFRLAVYPLLVTRIAMVESIVDEVLRGRIGLTADVTPKEAWGPRTGIEVLVIRDDVGGAADETTAAADIMREIRKADPELADTVEVRGEYCK